MRITLCGSTRFKTTFSDWDAILTMAGHTVYSICMGMSSSDLLQHPEKKRRIDLVYLNKIEASDAILVLNVEGYIGESTIREIEYARMNRKDVYWLNNAPLGQGILGPSVWMLQNLFEDKPIASISEAKAYVL